METVNLDRVSGLKRKRAARYAAYLCGASASRAKFARVDMESRESVCPGDHSCRSQKSIVYNYANFFKSGLPQRLMFFSNGEWSDFPDNVTQSLIEAFTVRKSAVEVSIRSCVYVVDFLHMVLINLRSGVRQSVAWIDESSKCFFPRVLFDCDDVPSCGGNIEVKLELGISGVNGSKPDECIEVLASPLKESEENEEVKEVIAENGVPYLTDVGFGPLHDKLVRLERGGNDYLGVQNVFLRGLGMFVQPSSIIGIYRHSPTIGSALARLQTFEKQVDITKRYRGHANVRRAWHGSSREGIAGILHHGFDRSSKPSDGVAYGTGIYFSPEDSSHFSANYCDVDENGVQHMVLCRIIMGSMEQIQPGSEQFHPTCDDFDSGVDDLQNPNHYIIWNTHMNTHIHPEFIVSFKLPLSIREYLAGLKNTQCEVDGIMAKYKQATLTVHPVRDSQHDTLASGGVKMPTSAWMPFPMLFAAIQNNISPLAKDILDLHYNAFKSKKITREELIKKVRYIVGDKLLKSTLQRLQSNQPPLIPRVTQEKLMRRFAQS
ncbi:inactive poly [ADP-ribose] polymerase RCD1-like isoform X2 [Tasmannia lanceolata]|uniref:inactive poly [ADP-ribose] polymerase RCD1-like isoform X2 n=1 Tax=Tasmannia lanceolata TaxID=3420 RepID=UPI004063BE1C